MSADVLLKMASAAQTAAGVSAEWDTTNVDSMAIDINVSAITGGASTPGIKFTLERLGADGLWYGPVTSGNVTATGNVSIDVSSALGVAIVAAPLTSASQHFVPTKRARLSWVFVGGTPPTSVTFSASVVGRS